MDERLPYIRQQKDTWGNWFDIVYCDEMHITKPIPVYSTAFLKSPVIAGLFKPCIYLSIHLISDYNANDIRYMLMHELEHYKYKDAFANYLMNIIGVLYWFNPLVWYSLKQMQKRIRNIANYHPASFRKNLHSAFVYIMIALFLSGTAPILSIQAAENNRCYFNENNRTITYIDLSDVFEEYNGSFVLYDAAEDAWQIYNKEYATTRISPASTFKIYSALFGLETGSITPEQSLSASLPQISKVKNLLQALLPQNLLFLFFLI